jgi:hypothetical protein
VPNLRIQQRSETSRPCDISFPPDSTSIHCLLWYSASSVHVHVASILCTSYSLYWFVRHFVREFHGRCCAFPCQIWNLSVRLPPMWGVLARSGNCPSGMMRVLLVTRFYYVFLCLFPSPSANTKSQFVYTEPVKQLVQNFRRLGVRNCSPLKQGVLFLSLSLENSDLFFPPSQPSDGRVVVMTSS